MYPKNGGQYTYTMKYYSVTKKNAIMPFAATRMDLEFMTLSEVREGKYCMISLICEI